MTTILPEKNKKDLRREYLLKFGARVLWALFLVGTVWLVLEMTIFYSIQIESKVLHEQISQGDQVERGELLEEYKAELKNLKQTYSKFSVEALDKKDLVEQVFAVSSGLVRVESIYANESTEKGEEGLFVVVSGIANSRESLFAFTGNLENSKQINDLNLPISSFAKNSEIPFSLTFTYKNE